MIRCNLVKGDKSALGGEALDGIALCTIMGREMTFLGASVYCPACKTTGQIVGVGPRHRNDWMGKQDALEGDICVCRCDPPPVMIASQRAMFHSFEAAELAAMGFDVFGKPLEQSEHRSDDQMPFDEQVRLTAAAGRSMAGMRYRIEGPDGPIKEGRVPANGELPRVTTQLESAYIVLWGDEAVDEEE
ncbi:hypothetical protein D769_15707 [Cupriavidus sp. HMR-1]|nr:hypothetical protein D769_15707 [Cupriavidus sp. HMR-1]